MNLASPVTRATAQTGQMDVGDMDMVKSAAAAASSKQDPSLDIDFADRWASEQFSDSERNFSGSATGSLSGQHNAATHYPFPYNPVGDNDEDLPDAHIDNDAHNMFNNEYDEEYGCAHTPDPTCTICVGTHVTRVRCSRRQSARGPGTTSA